MARLKGKRIVTPQKCPSNFAPKIFAARRVCALFRPAPDTLAAGSSNPLASVNQVDDDVTAVVTADHRGRFISRACPVQWMDPILQPNESGGAD